jgi:hypothetical protein
MRVCWQKSLLILHCQQDKLVWIVLLVGSEDEKNRVDPFAVSMETPMSFTWSPVETPRFTWSASGSQQLSFADTIIRNSEVEIEAYAVANQP